MSAADRACTTAAERACLDALRGLAGCADSGMERHCLRVYEIARELGSRAGREHDRELLLCAAWLHDAGLYPGAASKDAYVRDGGRLADRILGELGWPQERRALCADAIERHHELRRQWDRGTEVELLRRADLVDVSQGLVRFGLERSWLGALAERVPRDRMLREIGGLVARAARERPLTLPAIFLRGA